MHVGVVGCLVLLAGEVQSHLIDDLRALFDPLPPGLGGNVLLNPLADRAAKGRFFQLLARTTGSLADERPGCDQFFRSIIALRIGLRRLASDRAKKVRDGILRHEITLG